MKREHNFEIERRNMVENQLRYRDIRDKRVLNAMKNVPRHKFVPEEYQHLAYTDGPLPIGRGQTISQPYIVALMTQLLDLTGTEKVLEVGTGSGYQAAVLGYLAEEVYTIERQEELAHTAIKLLESLGLENVHVYIGDGSEGLPEFSPYSGILVTAAAPRVPRTLLDQLTENGKLVIPVGGRGGQFLERWIRDEKDFHSEDIIPVAFVPLIGKHGWDE